jgi:hypothetical protein
MGRVRENHDLVWGGQVDSISGFDARVGDYSSTMSQSGTYDLIFPQGSWLFGSGSPVEIRLFGSGSPAEIRLFGSGSPAEIRLFGSGSPVEIRLFGRKKRKGAKSQRRKEDRKPPASPSGPLARRGFGLRTRDSPRRDRPRTGKKARKCLGIQQGNPLDGGRTKLRTRRRRFFLRTDG